MSNGIDRDKIDIEEQVAIADEQDGKGSAWPGMSYEQGVSAALRWALGDEDTPPMSEE